MKKYIVGIFIYFFFYKKQWEIVPEIETIAVILGITSPIIQLYSISVTRQQQIPNDKSPCH